jgi:hypothetical protein
MVCTREEAREAFNYVLDSLLGRNNDSDLKKSLVDEGCDDMLHLISTVAEYIDDIARDKSDNALLILFLQFIAHQESSGNPVEDQWITITQEEFDAFCPSSIPLLRSACPAPTIVSHYQPDSSKEMTQTDDADDYRNSNDGNEYPTTETTDTLIEANVHDHQVLCPQKVRPNTSFPPSMPCKKWQHLMDYHKQCDIPLDPKDDGESHGAAPDDEKIGEDLEDELIGHVDAENGEDYDDDDLFKMMEPEDNESLTVSNCEKYSDAGHATNNGELLDTEGSLTVKSVESAEDFEYGDERDHEKVYVDHCSYYGEYYGDHSSYSEDFDGTVDKFHFHMIHNHKVDHRVDEVGEPPPVEPTFYLSLDFSATCLSLKDKCYTEMLSTKRGVTDFQQVQIPIKSPGLSPGTGPMPILEKLMIQVIPVRIPRPDSPGTGPRSADPSSVPRMDPGANLQSSDPSAEAGVDPASVTYASPGFAACDVVPMHLVFNYPDTN